MGVRAFWPVCVAAVWFTSATAHGQAPCGQGAQIAGSPALVASLRDALRERGLPVMEDAECASRSEPSVEVSLTERGLIRVMLLGPDGATAVRDVDRMTTAALLVESWGEAEALDLLEPAPASVEPSAISESPTETSTPSSLPPAASPELPVDPSAPVATVTAAAIAAFGNEGSSWFGAHLGACAHAGPTCIGGSLRYLSDSGLSDAPSERGQRTYLGGDLDVSLPFGVAPGFILTPSVALGLGWLDVVTLDAGRAIVTDALRAVVSGSLAAAVAVIDWLSLALWLAATWSPLARQAAWSIDGAAIDPDPVFLGSVMLGVRAEIR